MTRGSAKTAFITGITGQDGSYLAELLLEKGYKVHGLIRRSSSFNTGRIDHIFQDPHKRDATLFLHYGDLSDSSNVSRLLEKIAPDEIYHLGAQSHVRVSFDLPEYTSDITGLGALRLLDAIRETRLRTRFYQASSSEIFGDAKQLPLHEDSPMRPRSPYGVSKLYAYWMTRSYRDGYGLFACNGILFNHESERRGETFVTRKITRALARIKLGREDRVYLGNLDARRDWGYAKDYVEAMWLILQQKKPDDYVVATNETHSVREFLEETARYFGFDIVWKGKGLKERGVDRASGRVLVEIDPVYFRPAEVDVLWGDYAKARRVLGWKPRVKFKELVRIMAEADYEKERLRP